MKRVGGGNGVWRDPRLDVDVEYLAQERTEILPSGVRIVERRNSAVAGANVQVPILRSKREAPAIVRFVRLLDGEENPLVGRIGNVWVGCDFETADDCVAVEVGTTHEEVLFGVKAGRKGDVKQASFAAATDPRRDIQEENFEDRPRGCGVWERGVPDDTDTARLLNQEEPAAAIAGVGKLYGKNQSGDDFSKCEGRRRSAVRRYAEHAHFAPCNPAGATNGPNHHLVYATRRLNRYGEGLSILRYLTYEPLVQRAGARTVPQPELMHSGTGRSLREDQLDLINKVKAIR